MDARSLAAAMAVVAATASTVSGCGGGAAPAETPPPLTALGAARRGGSVALDATGGVAYAADADNRALHRIDLVTGEVATTALGGVPEQLVVLSTEEAGERVAVALRDQDAVVLLQIDIDGTARPIARAETSSDPWGMAATPAGELLVTSTWGRTITSLDAATLQRRWSVPTGREPRGVVVSRDGKRAFVTHLVGDSVTVVELDQPAAAPRRLSVLGGGSYRDRVEVAIAAGTRHPIAANAYAAAISDSGERLFVPHVLEQNGSSTPRSIPGAYGGVPVEEETSIASVAVIAAQGERALASPLASAAPGQRAPLAGAASMIAETGSDFAVAPASAPCRQARAVAVAGQSLLVASHGTDELVELDARSLDPALSVKRSLKVGEGPTGVDWDPATRTAVVWNQHAHDLAIVDLDVGSVIRLPVAADPLDPEIAAGRRLFVAEHDRRISRDGRACAGCHPDGRDDGIVWKLGAGPRQTPTLVGRVDRGPFGWLGKHARLEDNMRETMGRLGGSGLRDEELSQLAAFLRRGLLAPKRDMHDVDQRAVARGREIFESDDAGCASCHLLDAEGSDRKTHDVSSRAVADTSAAFRTPPLSLVQNTAPYFHDGRYQTIEQLLADNLDRMGQTSHLSPGDLTALAAFLRTL